MKKLMLRLFWWPWSPLIVTVLAAMVIVPWYALTLPLLATFAVTAWFLVMLGIMTLIARHRIRIGRSRS